MFIHDDTNILYFSSMVGPDSFGDSLHVRHSMAIDHFPICVLKEPEHDVLSFRRLSWSPCYSARALELPTCLIFLVEALPGPKCDMRMVSGLEFQWVDVRSCGWCRLRFEIGCDTLI